MPALSARSDSLPLRPFLRLARRVARFVFFIALVSIAMAPMARAGDGRSMAFIRDAEIEDYLRDLGAPIFRAAGIAPSSVRLMIVQNGEINAFVAGGMNIFFYTGLLQATDTAEQLAGVIAHETGHIAGGHLVRGTEAMRGATAQAIIGMLAGIAAGAATGRADVAMGAIGGAQEVAARGLMSYSREQESSADAAAMRFFDALGQSCAGFLAFMKKLAGQELLPVDRQIEYVRTHPLSQDRITAIEHHMESRPDLAGKGLSPAMAARHMMTQAKLLGYLHPETALLRYTDKDPRPAARYARAIALYRTGSLARALTVMETLLQEGPDNPFFIELKAQMLFENGRVAEAAVLYKKTASLLPDSALVRVAYAHALLEGKAKDNGAAVDLAIQNLLEADRLEGGDPQTWRLLAAAWGRKGGADNDPQYKGLVSYALAEEAEAKGHTRPAGEYADRALKDLKKGSPYWLRAQDIKLNAAAMQDKRDN